MNCPRCSGQLETIVYEGTNIDFASYATGRRLGPNIIVIDTAAPSSGAWLVGDRCEQKTPVAGQPVGWLCTVSGSPGTWVALANL